MSVTVAIPEFRRMLTDDEDSMQVEQRLLTDARRLATRRGEPMRLRLASDGVWSVISIRSGEAVSGGRTTLALSWLPDVKIDAMGGCVLAAGVAPPVHARGWDALGCRWQQEGSTP